MSTLRPKFVAPGVGPVLRGPGGDRTVPKVSAAETGDRFSLAHYEVAPGAGPPLHVHEREDEAFWILEGEVTFHVGGEVITAPQGSLVYGPRGAPHCFKNRTGAPAKMLLLVTPAQNFETFYGLIGAPGPGGAPPTDALVIERIGREAAKYGIQILGPNPL